MDVFTDKISSPGFSVHRPRQYDTICWEFDLFPGFFVSPGLTVLADGINGCAGVLQ